MVTYNPTAVLPVDVPFSPLSTVNGAVNLTINRKPRVGLLTINHG